MPESPIDLEPEAGFLGPSIDPDSTTSVSQGEGGLPGSGNAGTGSVATFVGGAPNQGGMGASEGGNAAAGGSGSTEGPAAGAGGNVSGGSAGEAGSSGGVPSFPPVECSNQDQNTLPIDESRIVSTGCNAFGIQGQWYCYDDGVNPTSCAEGVPEYRAGEGLCLTGSTSVDPTFSAWGAGIGLVLNATEAGATFDAAAQGIIGFRINISGDAGGLALRINFRANENRGSEIAPFWEVPGAGNYDVRMADATVPEAWMVPESGSVPDESALYSVDITLVGGDLAADYDICIESLTPITSSR